MSDRAWQAVITAAIGLGALVLLRVVLGILIDRAVKRAAARKQPDYVARVRTRLTVLRRVVMAFAFAVVLWSVLEIFPTTEQIARALLASSAFLALVIGVAFSVPLGNIGAGILLSLSQPARIGDRITVGEVTGTVDEITLIHTIVRTDQGLTAFVPNSQMITTSVIGDVGEAEIEDANVAVIDIGERTTWLSVTGYAPRPTAVDRVAAELRERALHAMAAEGLLPQ
jgi:small-conductance mechanosensitive channel